MAKAQTPCKGYASHDCNGHLVPWNFERRAIGPDDVSIDIKWCGMCHSDIHQARNEWGMSIFPMVPGHEIVGVVKSVGSNVNAFKEGDPVGVGCMVNSCQSCPECAQSLEQYCGKCIYTYSGVDVDGTTTQGGYSTHVVVNHKFVLRFPESLDMAAGAPLLCAGITVWSPMRYYGLDKPGMRIGVLGLGGLGHMAVKFGKAFGCHVTVISTSPSKKEEAMSGLGADAFLVSKDEEEMKAAARSLDGIINTVSAQHDLAPYLDLLKTNGKLVLVGVPPEPFGLHAFQVIGKRVSVGGSLIGGIKETQEMLDFCGENGIVSDIEKVDIHYVNTAMERMIKSDVKYRFVIDIESLKK